MKYQIALIRGDGIGPEVVNEAVGVLEAVGKKFGHTYEFVDVLLGGCATDAVGKSYPDGTADQCRACDAVLLGAVGGPRWGSDKPAEQRPETALLAIRKDLGLYANLRPATLRPAMADACPLKKETAEKGIDLMMVRELTGGIYFGQREKYQTANRGMEAADRMAYSEYEIERIGRRAFELARLRRKKVSSVDKANVLETSRLWRSVMHRLAEEYAPFSSILRGFILPKFFLENCGAYLAAIRSIGRTEEYFYMPVFESAAMIPPQTRREALTEVRAQLDTVSGSILNIRVGGNDLSHAFGLRRPANRTIYDLRPVADILIDIVAAFGTQYVVSGPVWEYYSGEGWEEGLRREMELDLLNGFTGKTVIHPNQIPVVNEMLRVSQRDYADARAILNWDTGSGSLVSASEDGGRMNEYNTHSRWARRIVLRAERYGVRA